MRTRKTIIGWAAFGLGFLALLHPVTPVAGAVSDFCRTEPAHEYLPLVSGFPSLHHLPEDGQLGFAPDDLQVALFGGQERLSPGRLIAGSDEVGLQITGYGVRSIRLGWYVTVSLERLKSSGAVSSIVGTKTQKLAEPIRFGEREIRVGVPLRDPGYFRALITIDAADGSRLGKFGEYYRVVPSVKRLRMRVSRTAARPGQAVRTQVENMGTELVGIEAGPALERYAGGRWQVVSQFNLVPPISAEALLVGGDRGPCEGVSIPPDASPGAYRVSASLEGGDTILHRKVRVRLP